jgi:protein-tyrosine-phosphatase
MASRSVVFVCVANSCRSQMAEAMAKSLAGDQWDVWSAGSSPSGRVHPVAIEVMKELGLDLSGHRSKGLAELPTREWDYIVTMGCLPAAPGAAQAGGDACPAMPARHRLDWDIPDPIGLPLAEVRRIRDQIVGLVRGLIQEE